MPRESSLKFWKARKVFYCQIAGKRHYLGRDRVKARKEFGRLMANPPKQAVPSESVAAIADAFLDWVSKNRAADTYRWYLDRLQAFKNAYPALTVAELRPLHVQQWIDSYDVSNGTKRNHARAIQRALRWAEEQGYIDRSPIAHFKKPKGGVRQTIISPEAYQSILDAIPSRELRDLVTFAWEAGARAQECLLVERRHLEEHRIVLPVEDEKMQRAPRIIYLTEKAEAILQRLALRHPKGPIFRNTKGEPWTADAVVCAFGQLRGRMGRKVLYDEEFEIPESEINELIPRLAQNRRSGDRKTDKELREEARRKLWDRHAKDKAPRYCLTAFRHSFAHRLLRSGVDALTVSVLMGHVDPSMVARVYSHLSHAPDYLRESLKRGA